MKALLATFNATQTDTWLYVLMAGITAALGFVGHGLPTWAAPPLGILGAMLTALKAKRSPGKEDSRS